MWEKSDFYILKMSKCQIFTNFQFSIFIKRDVKKCALTALTALNVPWTWKSSVSVECRVISRLPWNLPWKPKICALAWKSSVSDEMCPDTALKNKNVPWHCPDTALKKHFALNMEIFGCWLMMIRYFFMDIGESVT